MRKLQMLLCSWVLTGVLGSVDAYAQSDVPTKIKFSEKDPQLGTYTHYLPRIDELYQSADSADVMAEMKAAQGNRTRDFKAMKDVPERAFAAGIVLSDVTFNLLNLADNDPAPKSELQKAKAALDALNLSDELKAPLKRIMGGIDNGTLKGKDLRVKLDEVAAETISRIEKTPGQRDLATVVGAAATLRTLYIASTAVSQLKSPTAAQLELFRQAQVVEYFTLYFDQKAAAEWKNSTTVKLMLPVFQQLSKLMAKEKTTLEDVKAMAELTRVLCG